MNKTPYIPCDSRPLNGIGFRGGDTDLYAYVGGDPVSNFDSYGLAPSSTWGGDDPGFDNPDEKIKELEKELENEKLTQKQISDIKRRIRELRRRPSNRQQHHSDACDNIPVLPVDGMPEIPQLPRFPTIRIPIRPIIILP
ncbi:hypothetical protein CCP4SC76_5460004 [Gammaproteobacteria bacterium]